MAWNTKEVIIISIATGLFFSCMTLYLQNKFQSMINDKVKQQTSNPLVDIVNSSSYGRNVQTNFNQSEVGTKQIINDQTRETQHVHDEQPVIMHEIPHGAGQRWTPLPVTAV